MRNERSAIRRGAVIAPRWTQGRADVSHVCSGVGGFRTIRNDLIRTTVTLVVKRANPYVKHDEERSHSAPIGRARVARWARTVVRIRSPGTLNSAPNVPAPKPDASCATCAVGAVGSKARESRGVCA